MSAEDPRARKNRRATRPAKPGVINNPGGSLSQDVAAEDEDSRWGERKPTNEERLIAERPPHWSEK